MDARSLRKAAILINTLDTRTADALLEQMGDEKAAAVRSAVMDLDEIDPQEQEAVIQAFMASQDPGRAAEAETPTRTAQSATEPAPNAPKTESTVPFHFLHQADPESVRAVLHAEHPQTAALVLAHLPPQQAADVIRLLEQPKQTEILSRVARMNAMDVEILRDVEEEMAIVFSTRVRASESPAGLSSLQAILAASQERQRRDWLQNIEGADPEIARQMRASRPTKPRRSPGTNQASVSSSRTRSQIRPEGSQERPDLLREPSRSPSRESVANADRAAKQQAASPNSNHQFSIRDGRPDTDGTAIPSPQMSFDELNQLNDDALALVLRSAPSQVSLVALAGAKRAFVERLLKQLPAKDAQSLNQKIERVGPIRLRDVEFAQQKLAQIAWDLAQQGRIQIPALNRFAAAA